MTRLLAALFPSALIVFTRLVTAVRADRPGCVPEPVQRIYYANHASHGDFALVWSVLPATLRRTTRPVAGVDYWLKTRLHRFMAQKMFRAVLIERLKPQRGCDPLAPMTDALDDGASLILFPEGTRNTTDAPLLPFKGGVYHLARKRPTLEFVPVWIANLNRVLPKGEIVPVPLLCTVTFGAPLKHETGETKAQFLARARNALLSLAPEATQIGESDR
ncbi:MAG: 1-acyl-sn-glycerol-3-phosphate acyltransferase [Alphaproteobacteria bacterium]|nr:1-acyl-sn-glycerol-3-phosphate acyltransferase [Alphaproteobacteria bacterium]